MFTKGRPALLAVSALVLSLGGATAWAESYQVLNSSLMTATYTANGPAIPTQPTNPWTTLVVPVPAITPFNSSLGTLVSTDIQWAPYFSVTAQGNFFATAIGAGPEAAFGIWMDATYTGLFDELGEVAPGPASGACNAPAVGAFTCGYSNELAIAGTFFIPPQSAPPTSTFSLYFDLFNIATHSPQVTFSSANIQATVGFVAVTTYEYTPAAVVPVPAAGLLLGSALGVIGLVRRRSVR